MKKRADQADTEALLHQREQFIAELSAGQLSLAQATIQMRKIARMTQPEYAKLLGIAPRVLMDIERGRANPRLDTLKKVAAPFGLQVGFILSTPFLAADERE